MSRMLSEPPQKLMYTDSALPSSHNGSLRSKKSLYDDDLSLQKTEYIQRSSLHIEPSNEQGTAI